MRVPSNVMNEIGYENCDYVSHETGWQFWPDTFQNWDVPIELHIPCRDPIGHLMSMCNYRRITFNCSREIIPEVNRCLLQMDRFSMDLVDSYTNIHAKCFPSNAINEYLDYMDGRLQRRKKEVEYLFRATNKPRTPESECIWNDKVVFENAKKYLLSKFDYYQYCDSCIGSKDDLLRKQWGASILGRFYSREGDLE